MAADPVGLTRIVIDLRRHELQEGRFPFCGRRPSRFQGRRYAAAFGKR
jgi:hypothetical protein